MHNGNPSFITFNLFTPLRLRIQRKTSRVANLYVKNYGFRKNNIEVGEKKRKSEKLCIMKHLKVFFLVDLTLQPGDNKFSFY